MSNNVTVPMSVDKYVGIPLSSYDLLANRPQINSVTLTGNKTAADLGLATPANVETEKTRAQGAESANASAISTEQTRAQTAENALGNKIGDLDDLNTSVKTDLVSAVNAVKSLLPTIDGAMSDTSTNPVQNKTIKAYIDTSTGAIISQTYSGTSASAQSGVAVKQAFANERIIAGQAPGSTLGEDATAEGSNTTASGAYSHAEGHNTTASSNCSHAEGYNTTASGAYSHSEGKDTTASGVYSHAEGYNVTAEGENSHAEGYNVTAEGDYSHAEGSGTTASGAYSHAEGSGTTASGAYSHAEGKGTTASGFASHAEGQYNASGANQNESLYSATNNAFMIGNGTSTSLVSNAFRVTFSGATYGLSAFNSSGADYAEYFEWADGNPNAEDRVGYFVTFDGANTIRKANANDEILGVVSGTAGVIGDSYDDNWQGMYDRDDFGRLQYEEVTTEAGTEKHIKRSSEYDPTVEYVPRSQRKEWDCIGLLGKLYVRDDGTCTPGSKCKCGANGIATASTDGGYRVLERVKDNIVRIFVK